MINIYSEKVYRNGGSMKNFKKKVLSLLLAFFIVVTSCFAPVSYGVSIADEKSEIKTDMQLDDESKGLNDENEELVEENKVLSDDNEGTAEERIDDTKNLNKSINEEEKIIESEEPQEEQALNNNINILDSEGYDMEVNGKITNVTISKKDGTSWKPATEFEDGDSVQGEIKYSFGDDDISGLSLKGGVAFYQLPLAIKINQAVDDGKVYITGSDEAVGTYTITTDGLIEIHFDKKFLNKGTGFDGNVKFTATVTVEGTGESGEVVFPGDGDDIVIKKPEVDENDISIKKESVLKFDRTSISYKITISTEKGTGDEVKLSDNIVEDDCLNLKYSYDENSINVIKISKDGTETEVTDRELTWTTNSDGQSFGYVISKLPELGEKEQYIVTYDMNVGKLLETDSHCKISNLAEASSGKNKVNYTDGKEWDTENSGKISKGFLSNELTDSVNMMLTTKWTTEFLTYKKFEINHDNPLILTDEFSEENSTDENTFDHYSYASELEKDFKNGLRVYLDESGYYLYDGDGNSVKYSKDDASPVESDNIVIKINYYNENGELVAADSSSKIKKFTVTITPKVGFDLESMIFRIDSYITLTDLSKVHSGYQTISNNKIIYNDDYKAQSQSYYTVIGKFLKELKTGETDDGKEAYNSGEDNEINYGNGTIKYRLRLRTAEEDDGKDLVITDVLPEGATYIEGSLKGRFADDNEDDKNNGNFHFIDPEDGGTPNPSCDFKINGEGRQVLTITVNQYLYGNGRDAIYIYYEVDISNDPAWKEEATEDENIYTNEANWGSDSSTTTTKVTSELKKDL